jgi:hypothetical protein
VDTLSADRHGQEIAAAWIGKEKLRDALNLRPHHRIHAVRARRPRQARLFL